VSCRDRTGLVAALSNFVFDNGGNIIDADQHADLQTGLFFMRLVWSLPGFKLGRPEIHAALVDLAARFDLTWELTYSDIRPRVAVLASKTPHCLYDLLLSHQLGELGGELCAVISNTRRCGPSPATSACASSVPSRRRTRGAERAAAVFDELRIIRRSRGTCDPSPEIVAGGPAHHQHPPLVPAGLVGAAHHQAQARGVKVIGATAHYVTSELDQGPIIEQDVCRVSHRDDVDALVQKGRERSVRC
jgi:formyltetrahydrofolate deformylase